MSFWENVDIELEYKGINRKTLAQEAGFSLCNVGKGIKLGSFPAADTAVRIAKVLGVTVEYLVTGENNSSEKEAEKRIQADIDKLRKYRKIIDNLDLLSEVNKTAVMELVQNLEKAK